jgi:hypothetical protein
MMARYYAGILGSLAFATVIMRGLLHGAGADSTLGTAMLCLLGFTLVGLVVGHLAATTIHEGVWQRMSAELEAQSEESER